MIIKRLIFKKLLSNGSLAEVNLARRNNEFIAALFLDGRLIPGPTVPQPLNAPKGDVTHWIGGRPTVGLTESEAVRVIEAVDLENATLKHQGFAPDAEDDDA